MVGSERMMLSVVSNETDRQSVWDPALGLGCQTMSVLSKTVSEQSGRIYHVQDPTYFMDH